MGLLSRHLFVLGLLAALGCASTAPPRIVDRAIPAGRCGPLRGTDQGLLIALDVPAGTAEAATAAVFRDAEQLRAISIADLGALPQQVIVGDGATHLGVSHRYVCGLWRDHEPIWVEHFQARGGVIPPPAEAPLAAASPSGVALSWQETPETWFRLYRRNVLLGDEAVAVSPHLQTGGWFDETAAPGAVYAYSLEAAHYVDGVPWVAILGAESYVEMLEP